MIVAVDVHEPVLLGQLESMVAGLSNICSVDDHMGAVPLAILNLEYQSINTVLKVAELPQSLPCG
jgi:hypothetical protein